MLIDSNLQDHSVNLLWFLFWVSIMFVVVLFLIPVYDWLMGWERRWIERNHQKKTAASSQVRLRNRCSELLEWQRRILPAREALRRHKELKGLQNGKTFLR